MKEQDDNLTLQETERLCHLFMECELSVLEETELKFLLTQVDYHSALIDEVRRIMDIDTIIAEKQSFKSDGNKKLLYRKWAVFFSIAASVAVVFCIGLNFIPSSSHSYVESQSSYVAYVDGHRLSDEEARIQIEAEEKSADDFIKEMSELEALAQQKIDNILTR